MKERKVITEQLADISLFDVFSDTTLSQAQSSLAETLGHLQSCTKEKFRNFRFQAEYTGYDGVIEVFVVADRDETDAEYHARLEKERKQEERRQKAIAKSEESYKRQLAESEEKELAEYLRLKKKYGVEK